MNKTDLIAKIATGADVSRAQAERMLDTFIGAVSEALTAGDHVTLAGFARFAVVSRAERRGRHPQTGEELIIPARKVPRFKAGKQLQDAVASLDRGNQEAAH